MMHLLKLKFKDVSTQNFSFFLCSRVMQSQLQPLQTGCHNAYSRLNIIYIYYCYTAKKKNSLAIKGWLICVTMVTLKEQFINKRQLPIGLK